jgi:hypothetical protein
VPDKSRYWRSGFQTIPLVQSARLAGNYSECAVTLDGTADPTIRTPPWDGCARRSEVRVTVSQKEARIGSRE